MITRNIHIKITEEHIAKGKKFSSSRDPIALAIKDACPEVKAIDVNFTKIKITLGDARYTAEATDAAFAFIMAFDDPDGRFEQYIVGPFSTTLCFKHNPKERELYTDVPKSARKRLTADARSGTLRA